MKHFHKFTEFVLDFLFPRSLPAILIENMKVDEIVRKISKAKDTDWLEVKAMFDYRNELTKQAVWEIKYRKNEKILNSFCVLFYEYIIDELVDVAIFNDFKNPILIPIPSSRKRLEERGYNQCDLIAKELARIDGGKNLTLLDNVLEKTKESPSQTSARNRSERLKNLKECFSIKNPEKILGANIILIDDVITTGATMSEAKKTLLRAGARRVICFALAH